MANQKISHEDLANARRLAAIWEERKKDLNLTQVKAAKHLGFQQSMVSQLLRGVTALNTDHVIKLAQLLRVSPGDIDPRLSSLNFSDIKLRQVKVPIIASLSGAATGAFQHVEISTRMTRQLYGISVDDDSLGVYARRGSTLIVSQEEEPISGDEVFIRFELDGRHIHMVSQYVMTDASREVVVVQDLLSQAKSELDLNRIEVFDPIVAVERPEVNRPVRINPSRKATNA